jgi:glycosyltransferase involved in cell wall biosynthesis
LATLEPIARSVYQNSTVILCKSQETLACIPQPYRHKCRLYLEIGIEPSVDVCDRRLAQDGPQGDREFQILYVGRLIYWKGLHLGLKAFAQFHAKQQNSRLTVVGSGADRKWLHNLAQQLGIADAVDWIDWMPQDRVLQFYSRHDAFLFPSLHDSSGNVVLEALSQGLPVICLDLGGPGVMVDESCGRVVKTKDVDEQVVIQALSDALKELAENTKLSVQLSRGAMMRSQEYQWEQLVNNLYSSL